MPAIDAGNLVPIADAAERLGVSIHAAYKLVKRHGLGFKLRGRVVLTERELEYMSSRVGRVGRPSA